MADCFVITMILFGFVVIAFLAFLISDRTDLKNQIARWTNSIEDHRASAHAAGLKEHDKKLYEETIRPKPKEE